MGGGRKIALVTGSATGIGANIALDLAANGYFVLVTGRNESNLRKVVQQCNSPPEGDSGRHDPELFRATYFKADLTNDAQLDALINFVLVSFGRIDVLINNACSRGNYKHLLECDEAYDDFKRVMHLNVVVPFHLVQRCLVQGRAATVTKDELSHRGRAVVINVSSIASQVVVPLHAYSISKACLSELSKQLAKLANDTDFEVLSVTISPGPVLTEERPHHAAMSDLTLRHQVGSTQEISDLVMFAISNAEMFNGKELNIDGGYVTKQKLPLPPTD